MKELLLNNKKRLIPLLGGAIGILLLLAGGLLPTGSKGEPAQNDGYYEVRSYTEALEERIEALCTSVSGITHARVLLTLDSSTEYVYAKNEEQAGTSGGNTADYLLLNEDGREAPLLLMEVYPEIRGIAVVCTGGDEPQVQQTIIELLSAALGISTNRVKVAGG